MPDARSFFWYGSRLLIALSVSLSNCTMGPDFVPPKAALPTQWQNSSTSVSSRPISPEWWKMFNDPVLDSLMRRAALGNPDMAMAIERIKAERIQRGAVSAEGMPKLDAQASYSRERLGTAGVGDVLKPLLGIGSDEGGSGPDGVAYSNYSLGGAASWELDLWGRQRRMQETADAEYTAVQADGDALRLSLQAEIARTYFQWRYLNDALNRTETKLDIAQKTLNIAHAVQSRGLLATIDLDEQQTLCHRYLAERDEVDTKRASLQRALATLVTGRPDTVLPELSHPTPLQSQKIPHITPDIPSEIARNRPDIRAAEARLHAATAAIGVAKADFYPRVLLTGQFSVDALTVAQLGWNARNTSFGPSISLPIFNGGRLSRQLELRHSQERSAGIAYQMTVMNAWREIEDILAKQRFFRSRHEDLLQTLDEKKMHTNAQRQRYNHGDVARTDVLATDLSEYETEADIDQIVMALLINDVDLSTALGNR